MTIPPCELPSRCPGNVRHRLVPLGLPISEAVVERDRGSGEPRLVLYFERQRFEYHPEHARTPYHVLLGRLGAEALEHQGRAWQTLPAASPSTPHYFRETGHAIAPQFWDYWRSHGLELGDRGVSVREALALFGYPISEPQVERNSSGDHVLIQWIERTHVEFHPGSARPYQVLLGRLAADRLRIKGRQRIWSAWGSIELAPCPV
ncbi:MAG: hypothetical protein M3R24_40195 [Chloroflexota bacterium]|nr:hypothetical protein [Chloroflexota bacterium]